MTDSRPVPSAGNAGPAVRAQGLGKEIDGRRILAGLDFELPRGSFTALLGANGAGKSTLLKILSTLVPATQGELHLLNERCVPEAVHLRARIGLIGHGAMLYRDLSPLENLVFFGRLYGVRNPPQRAAELLEWLGLAHRGDDPVKTFSRGMVQRVAIARALMHEPDLLLADEPFAGLDAPSTSAVQQMLTDLHRQGRTIILANHDIAQTLELVECVLVLRGGQLVVDAPAADHNAR
ncbi:MAG: ABC transporter ATP-binding protein, partial [Phycisphaerales bacterium]|nr:ABC transporter ATP-binding protein [Phycisphaerales bacterium]